MKKFSFNARTLCLLFQMTLLISCTPEEEIEDDSPSTETPIVISAPSALYVDYAKNTSADTTVIVAGVSSGQTIHLYSDSNCQSEVTQTVASDISVSINVTGLSVGTHTFYAKAQSGSNLSNCSSAFTTYENVQCPTGYIQVPGNASRGVSPFCVMQFEAKDVSSVPTSQASSAPWMNISAVTAKSECQSLNSGGSTSYDLISNQEWMTIAEDAQSVTTNWHNGSIGTWMNYGNSTNEKLPMAVADQLDPWSGVTLGSNPTTEHSYRRTHNLSNGEVIWDFAGNAGEIVDFGTSSTYTSPPACSGGTDAHRSAKDILDNSYCPALNTTHYFPSNPEHVFSVQSVGSFRGSTSSGTTLVRGGAYNFLNYSGVVGILYSPNAPTEATGTHIGFRCVYRLNPPVSLSTSWARNFDTTPDVTVSGVQYGSTVKLYTDSACTNQVASKVATGSSVTLTTSTLALGSYNFYFKVTDRNNTASACSTTSLSYEAFACPSDYVAINGSASRNVNPFCVMKYEARTNAGTNPASYPASNLPGQTAKSECLSRNSGAVKYNLISNLEWMTIGDNIASVDANWSSGTAGTGSINRGNSNGEKSVLAIADTADHWSGLTSGWLPTTDFNYRRTHYLPSGDTIWDFAGNAEEVVDYGTGTTAASFQTLPACTQGDGTAAQEFSFILSNSYCEAITTNHYLPIFSSYGSSQGAGTFVPRQGTSTIVRGGAAETPNSAGIYTLRMANANGTTSPGNYTGYRCVYRP